MERLPALTLPEKDLNKNNTCAFVKASYCPLANALHLQALGIYFEVA